MSAHSRLRKNRNHLNHQSSHKTEKANQNHRHHLRPVEEGKAEIPLALDDNFPRSVWLVARRPPLSEHKILYRWLARWLYSRIHWTPDYGIEYQGVFTDEAEARWAASAPGMFIMEVPFNASLPEETCQYGKHDFPHSEESQSYRSRQLPFVAVPRERMAQLERKVDEVYQSAHR